MYLLRSCVLICSSILCYASAAFAAERLPVPEGAKQKEAIELLKEAFGKELESKDANVQKVLAGKLLKQADDPGNDATMRFVLLKMAAYKAADAGDAETALGAVEQLGEQYKEKTGPIELRVLDRSYKAAKKPEEYAPVAQGYVDLVTKAIQKDDFETAAEAAKQAGSAARKSKDKDLYEQSKDLAKAVKDAEKQYKVVEAAFSTLDEKQDDSDANLAVGRYLCFIKGEWDEGLAHLRKGSDKALAELAAKDTGTPEDPKELLALADAWYELGEKEKKGSQEQNGLFARAKDYYEKVLPSLSGISEVAVRNKIEKLPSMGSSAESNSNFKVDRNFTLVKAEFGEGSKSTEATEYMKSLFEKEEQPVFTVGEFMVNLGDPNRGGGKGLRVTYKYKGISTTLAFTNNEKIILVPVKKTKNGEDNKGRFEVNGKFTLIKAEFGQANKWIDATEHVKNLFEINELPVFSVGKFMVHLGDPNRGGDKGLKLTYEYRGKTNTLTFNNGERIALR